MWIGLENKSCKCGLVVSFFYTVVDLCLLPYLAWDGYRTWRGMLKSQDDAIDVDHLRELFDHRSRLLVRRHHEAAT